ncbi:MAG: late competence development ComFB family protein [Oscillibacter sp.]|nr:late competence development ComFB family protein [Oscillibacter sp.]
MPRRGSRTGKGSKSSKTARVLGLLTNPANVEEAESAAEQTDRMDDKAAQAEIRSALEQELLGLLPNGDLAPAADGTRNPFAPAPQPAAPAPQQEDPLSAPQAAAPAVDDALPVIPEKPKTSRRARGKKQKEPDITPAEAAPSPAPAPAPVEAPAPAFMDETSSAAPVPMDEIPSAAAVHTEEPAAEILPTAEPTPPVSPVPTEAAPAADHPVIQNWEPPHVDISKEGRENLVLGHPEEWICFNLTQALVEEKTDKYMKLFGMCTCARCKVDVTAIALTNLPVKYVATQNRDVVPLLSMYETKYSAEVVSQVISACKKVMTRPHHGRN